VISVLRFPLLLDLYPLCAHATQRVLRQHRDAAEPMGLDDEEPWMAPQGSPRHSAPDPTDVIMVLSEEESGVAARTLPIRHHTVPVSFAIPMDLGNESRIKTPTRNLTGWYELCAVGAGDDNIRGNHAIAYAKHDGVWLLFDDAIVTVVGEEGLAGLCGGAWHNRYAEFLLYRAKPLT